MILLNIGEDTATGQNVTVEKVLAALRLAGALPMEINGHFSDSEYTHIVQLPRELSHRELRDLAIVLDQDAIAQWDGRHGMLAGPRADKWGPFNPAYFLTLDGDRLSESIAAVAA